MLMGFRNLIFISHCCFEASVSECNSGSQRSLNYVSHLRYRH